MADRILVGISELGRAHKAHLRAAGSAADPSSMLLLFYAAECGVKRLYLRQFNLKSLGDIGDPDLIDKHGHDLAVWIKELRVPARDLVIPPTFKLTSGSGPHASAKAHQAWRYGTRLELADQAALVEWLHRVIALIKKRAEDDPF